MKSDKIVIRSESESVGESEQLARNQSRRALEKSKHEEIEKRTIEDEMDFHVIVLRVKE
ncbi:hypothetical protein KIN20_024187 [Parelaphostrongylus tenuis]|uniref:Uncharacterized protein n=1 Tax=Parelaphostrongylus tenuis TaxID=148309 RepID=A0AAD5QW61_PARTN|nr:hypothetical protein KIN20_024187 [Parelaphostrongylus tenuis]